MTTLNFTTTTTTNNTNTNTNSMNPLSMDTEWSNLIELSTSLIPQDGAPRIQRSLRGIEKEAQRLGSKQKKRVPNAQML